MVEFCAFKLNPLLLVVDDRVATGLPDAIPVTANLALVVVVPPRRKSCVVIL